MTQDPWLILGLTAVSVWLARSWVIDYRAAAAGRPNVGALPGARPASTSAVAVAAVGALLILVAETAGEHVLRIGEEQSRMTALLGFYSVLAAPVLEEVLFRGYLVIEHRGAALLWTGVVLVSLLFGLLHPFLWQWNGGSLTFHFGAKGWFSTAAVFAASLWFYTVRFFGLNPQRSLLPCVVAHATRNLGVFAIKYAQGFIGGWW